MHPNFALNSGAEPPVYWIKATQHYDNLFEVPVLFYAAAFLWRPTVATSATKYLPGCLSPHDVLGRIFIWAKTASNTEGGYFSPEQHSVYYLGTAVCADTNVSIKRGSLGDFDAPAPRCHLFNTRRKRRTSMQWNLSGTYFETCSCDAACPCAFMSSPSKGDCTLMVGWHIDAGMYGDTCLDGLNIALAAYSPGDMMTSPWKAALYVDDRANPAQREALTQIFTGKEGGHPARFAAHFGDVLGIKSVPIAYSHERKRQSLHIPDLVAAEINDITDEAGTEVAISGRPWSFAPGEPSVVARSQRLDYDDYDFHWHISGENGFHSPFQYQA